MIALALIGISMGIVVVHSLLVGAESDRPASGKQIYEDLRAQNITVRQMKGFPWTSTTPSYTEFLSLARHGSYAVLNQVFHIRDEEQRYYFRENTYATVVLELQNRVVAYNPDGDGIIWEAYYDSLDDLNQQKADRLIPWEAS
jgi:hypothetical protein